MNMRKMICLLAIMIFSFETYAFDGLTASKVVRNYSETIACQTNGVNQKEQYKAIEVNSGIQELGGLGNIYVVYWKGNVGCYGGNDTFIHNFTVIEQRGFSSIPPIVVTEYYFPNLELESLTGFSGGKGILKIQGISYGPNDNENNPTQEVTYTIKFINDEFVIQSKVIKEN
jgi:hypothetical protein